MLPTLKRLSLVFVIILSLAFFGYLVYTGMGAKTKASISIDTAGNGEIPYSTEGLVAQWTFNEPNGTSARSVGSCGKSCDGMLVNFAYNSLPDAALGTGWTTKNKLWGTGALMFDGVNDYVSLPSLPTVNGNATFETWVRFSSTNYNNPQELFNNNKFFIRKDGGSEGNKLSVFVKLNDESVEPRANSTTIPKPDVWYHVAGTWDGQSLKIYVNGVLEGATTRSGILTLNAVEARIGIGEQQNPLVNPFSGILDATRIYSRALSEKEILANFQAQNGVRPIPPPISAFLKPVGYWKFDEGTGNTVADSSENGNNGQLKGNNLWSNEGKQGAALNCNGTDTTFLTSGNVDKASNVNIFNWGTGSWSISLWVNSKDTAGTPQKRLIGRDLDANKGYWWLNWGNGKPELESKDDANVFGPSAKISTNIADGNWHHLAWVIDRSSHKVSSYVDGVQNNSQTESFTSTFNNTNREVSICTQYGVQNSFFLGRVDNVKLYNSAITPQQVAEEMNGQKLCGKEVCKQGYECYQPPSRIMPCEAGKPCPVADQLPPSCRPISTPTPQPVGQLTFTLGGYSNRTDACVYTGKISWSTKNVPGIKITVKGEDEKENIITKEPLNGSAETPWLQSKGKYLFSLYNNNTNTVLDTKTITIPPFACNIPTPTPIPQALTATPVPTGSLGGGAQLLFKVRMPDVSTSVGTVGNVKIEIKNKTETLFDFTTGLQRIQGTDYFSTPAPIELDIPNGTYTIYVKQLKTIRRSFTINLTRGKTIDCTQKNADTSCQSFGKPELAPLFSGDSDGFLNSAGSYNKIDAADLQKIVAKYGVSPLPPEPNGDFNLDGKIDVQDLGILGKNFGKKGD